MNIERDKDIENIAFLVDIIIKNYPTNRNKDKRDEFVEDVRKFVIFWGR